MRKSPGTVTLVFVAFGRSFDAFEAQMNRMAGAEDGLDLRALGL